MADQTVQATPSAEPRSAEKPEWLGLWVRTQRRAVTTLDVVGILVFDAIILFTAGGIVHAIDKWGKVDNYFFEVAYRISDGAFVLLYLIYAGWHVVEFTMDQHRQNRL